MKMVSFVQASLSVWHVYMPCGNRLQQIGTAYAGKSSAYFRALSGRGRLFPNLKEMEDRLERSAKVLWAQKMERAGRKAAA